MQKDGARGGFDEAKDEACNGALAGAGFTDEAEGFAAVQGERDVVDDGGIAIAFGKVAGDEEGRCHVVEL